MSLWLWFCFKYMKNGLILDVCIDITWSEYTAWIITKYCSCFRCSLLAYNIIVHLSTPKRYTRWDSGSMKRYIIFTRYVLFPMKGYRFVKVLLSCRNHCYCGRLWGRWNDHISWKRWWSLQKITNSVCLSVCLSPAVSVCLSVTLSLSCLCLSGCISGLSEYKLQSL